MSTPFQTVVLCEKPKQAQIFAKAFSLSNTKMIDGSKVAYYDKEGGLCVVHLSGHLLELKPPEHYAPSLRRDQQGWKLDALPVIPQGFRWQLEPKYDSRESEQKRIKALLKGIRWALVESGRPGEIAIAVDNDREGELLGWETLEYFKVVNHPKLTRLLYSQVSESAMRQAFQDRKSAMEWLERYLSGLARQYADWLIGMNVTMALTACNEGMIPPYTALNSGRVVYAICYLIYLRDEAIRNYVPQNFFKEKVTFATADGATYVGTVMYPEKALSPELKQLTDKSLADKYHAHIIKTGQGVVRQFDEEKKRTPPPVGFHRTGFDRHMIRKFGMDLDTITKALQILYDDKGLITYPRVDVKHLDVGMHAKMPAHIAAMSKNLSGAPQLTEQERALYQKVFAAVDLNRKSNIWKEGIETGESHHAIITTDQVSDLSGLSASEFLVYRELADRLLIQFLPDYEYSSTTVITEVDRLHCKTTGSVPLRRGWKIVSQDMEEEAPADGDDDNAVLPAMTVGQVVGVKASDTKTLTTKEPRPYTTDELLGDLENPKEFVSNKELLKRLKKLQIGTDGTRQPHVIGLETKGLVIVRPRKGSSKVKELIPTQKLLSTIAVAPGYFKYPEMSAYWEDAFMDIQQGKMTLESFLEKQYKLIHRFVEESKSGVYRLKEPISNTAKPCKTEGCKGFLFARTTQKGLDVWACGACDSSYFNKDGAIGEKMSRGGSAEKKDRVDWVPPKGTPFLPCTACDGGKAYLKKIEGKSWSLWECLGCKAAFFDNKGELGKQLEKKAPPKKVKEKTGK